MRRKLLNVLAAIILLLIPKLNFGQAPALGTTSSFALFTAAGAFNAAGASTIVTGDVGTNAGAYNAFPPGTLIGQSHVADAVSATAATDVALAYGSLSTVTCGQVISTTLGNGQVLLPDVYCTGAATTVNGDLILDGQGDPTSLFIFKFDGALATSVDSRIILTNGASICNVWWQVNGEVDLGENSLFQGTILANGAIHLLDGATLIGRGLSQAGAISLQNNVVTLAVQPTASVITSGGPITFCAGGSVVLSGNIGGTWSTGATTPTITVTTSGDFFVTNTANCGSVISNHIVVTVNPLPICSMSGSTSICTGGSTQLCAPAGSASYLWSTGATTQCITANGAGTFTVSVTSAGGCSSSCNATVIVNNQPACSITGNTSVCTGGSTQLCAPAGLATYLWSTGATTQCITVNGAGSFTVSVTSAGGCSSSCNATVIVNNQPACSITGNTSVCTGGSTQLCAPAGSASYLWSTGATTQCITVNGAGSFTVSVTSAGGCSSSCNATVIVNNQPACSITGNTSVCTGGSTQLCAPAGLAAYLWSTGATTQCITVNGAGSFTVSVTSAGGCSSSCNATVIVNNQPACSITGNTSVCTGGSTQLCAPAGLATYLWSTGATTQCITVNGAGSFTVSVTSAGGCSSSCNATVIVNNQPACSITGNTSICTGGSTQLCAPAGLAAYLWSTGATTQCITVNGAGSFTVSVTSAGGCSSSCNATVIVNNQPACSITGNTSVCTGGSTQLCAPAGSASYLWSTGATTQCITVNGAGSFTVSVTSAGGCSSSCNATVIVNNQPACSITGNTSVCTGGSTQLCAPAGLAAYLWSTGATTQCITANGAGTFTVSVTSAGGCSSSCNATVIVNNQPACSITGNTSICTGGSTQLCAPAGLAAYLWSTGATTQCITVNGAGSFTVSVTSAGGCSSSCNATVIINNQPACSITGNTSICTGGSTQLCAPAGSASYLWSTGATTQCITVNGAGTFTVSVTSTGGCSSSCNATVIVNNQPACSITGNTSICTGGSTQLCAPAGLATYLWSTGATTQCITVNGAGTFTVSVTSAGGCSSICTKSITVNNTPICTITGNGNICTGQSTQLCTPLTTGNTYLWSTGATTNCLIVSTAGARTVTVTNSSGCSSTCTKTVTVGTSPSCTITGNSSICTGGSTQLCAPAGCAAYLWSTGATTQCITVTTAGARTVTVTNSSGCSSTCTKTVTVGTSPSCTITGNSSICTGGSTQLCAPAGCAAYLWSTGATTQCITVTTAGARTVTVTNSSGCSSTCTKTVTVGTSPSCTITGNSSICTGGSTQLCAPAGCAAYLWSTGATTQCITVTTAGARTVTVTNSSGCSSTCTKTVTVGTSPSCTITGNSSICTGGSTQLCAPAGCAAYLWSTGATTQCITVTTAGARTVTVTNSSGCSSTCTKTVTVGTSPSCTITGNSSICTGGSTQLCAPAGCAAYLWSTGATTQCITVTTAGARTVTVTNSSGCSSTCTKTVTVGTSPSCTITGNNSICTGGSTQLCAPAGCAAYLWSTGATTQCITVTTAGTRTVTVTNSSGCSSTCTKTVTVGTSPSCTITGNSSICTGGSTQLCAPAGCAAYLWSTGATTQCITVTTAGARTVTVTNSSGCSSTCTKTVTVGTSPSCTITGNSSICTGGSTQLCAPAGCAAYLWSTGATTQCITVTTAGTRTVTVTNSSGCSSTCTKTVTVGTSPSCTITGNSSICTGGSTQLCAPAGCAAYLWSTGATTQCITVTTAGARTVTVTNSSGCSSTCTKTVTVNPKPACSITGNLIPIVGKNTTLCSPSGLSSYLWSTGATTCCLTVTCSGTYTVTIANSSGCTSSGSACVTYHSARETSGMSNAAVDAYDNIEVKAYPNPFSSFATIEFQNKESNSHIVVELYSLTGNKIATLFDRNVKQDVSYKVEVNAVNLLEGIYIYRIINGDKNINRKLILIK